MGVNENTDTSVDLERANVPCKLKHLPIGLQAWLDLREQLSSLLASCMPLLIMLMASEQAHCHGFRLDTSSANMGSNGHACHLPSILLDHI